MNIRFFQINPVELSSVSDLKQRFPDDCHPLLASSSLISIDLPIKEMVKPLVLTLPVPPGPNAKAKRPKTAAPGKSAAAQKVETRPKSALFMSSNIKDGQCNLYHTFNSFHILSAFSMHKIVEVNLKEGVFIERKC